MTEQSPIRALRHEMGLTLADFADLVGLKGKSSMSAVERSGLASLPVALRIEALSGGRIDAATLNDDVARSRAACGGGCADAGALVVPGGAVPGAGLAGEGAGRDHDGGDSAGAPGPSTGKARENSRDAMGCAA